MGHFGLGRIPLFNENATYGFGQWAVETYRCKPFGLAEPKRWMS
jgi:hypothetical protein